MFGVVEQFEKSGLGAVALQSNAGEHRVEVLLHGATITSWKRNGEERLLLSNKAVFDGKKAIRGGVPLVFPQFGRPDTTMAQHGFIRTAAWKFIGAVNADDSISGYFRLSHTNSRSLLKLSPIPLRIFNVDQQQFPFQALLHTYIRVPRIEDVTIAGLQGVHYSDKLDNNQRKLEANAAIIIDREVDRIYEGETDSGRVVRIDLLVRNQRYLTSESVGSVAGFNESLLSLANTAEVENLKELVTALTDSSLAGSLKTTDVVVWNAWEEKARSLDDLDDDAYFYYVCLEPGFVASVHSLQPNQYLSLSQKLF